MNRHRCRQTRGCSLVTWTTTPTWRGSIIVVETLVPVVAHIVRIADRECILMRGDKINARGKYSCAMKTKWKRHRVQGIIEKGDAGDSGKGMYTSWSFGERNEGEMREARKVENARVKEVWVRSTRVVETTNYDDAAPVLSWGQCTSNLTEMPCRLLCAASLSPPSLPPSFIHVRLYCRSAEEEKAAKREMDGPNRQK